MFAIIAQPFTSVNLYVNLSARTFTSCASFLWSLRREDISNHFILSTWFHTKLSYDKKDRGNLPLS